MIYLSAFHPDTVSQEMQLTFSLTPSDAKYFNNFNSLSVRSANIGCSNGAIFLMATLVLLGR